MRKLATLLLLSALYLLAGCSTTIEAPRRVRQLQSTPNELFFVWSSARQPAFNNLPSTSLVVMGFPAGMAPDNYPADHASFGGALRQRLEAEPALKDRMKMAELTAGHTPQQLNSVISQASRSAAVVVMFPERVVRYCTAGCFAFKVRVNYLAPDTRALVWTGMVDLPSKNQFDPYGPLAVGFAEALMKQFASEGWLPR